MGYYFSPNAPGKKHGPCKKQPCKHTDCPQMIAQAESKCRICGKQIGYEEKIYFEEEGGCVHFVCFWREKQ